MRGAGGAPVVLIRSGLSLIMAPLAIVFNMFTMTHLMGQMMFPS